MTPTNIVTGAFGYTGKYIARRLLEAGETVVTLTGTPDRPNEFAGRIRSGMLSCVINVGKKTREGRSSTMSCLIPPRKFRCSQPVLRCI